MAVALPAAAADKEYALKLTASPAALGNTTITAVFKNTSPGGGASSNIKSLRLVPPDGSNVTFPGAIGGTVQAGCVRYSLTEIRCENLTPIPKNGTFTLTVNANIPAPVCTVWNGVTPSDDVNTGAAWANGQWFDLVFYPTTLPDFTAKLVLGTGAVSMAVTGNPTSLVWGTPYTVTTTVTDACGNATSTAVNTTGTTANIVVAPTSSTTSPFVFTATPGSGSTGTITVNAPALGATQSLSFALYESGNLACGDTMPSTNLSYTTTTYNSTSGLGTDPASPYFGLPVPGWVGNAFRIDTNKDGMPCVLVNWRFDNVVINTSQNPSLIYSNSTNLEWDLLAQQSAMFQYSVNYKAEWAVGGELDNVDRKWKFKWVGESNLINAQSCLTSNLPTAHATLTAPVAPGDASISVGSIAASLPALPFPIVIDSERMVVTALNVSGDPTKWAVTRGPSIGGPNAPPSHTAFYPAPNAAVAKKVMSTSFPLYDSGGGVLKPMQMCIVDLGWAVVPAQACLNAGLTNPNAPGLPPSCLVPYLTIRDGGDGFGGRIQ